MKTLLLKPVAFVIVSIAGLLLLACNKSENEANDSPNSFTWTFEGNNYTANQDTAFTSGLGLNPFVIYAGNGTSYLSLTRRFYFTLSAFAVGSYPFTTGPAAPNRFEYIDDLGNNHGGISGTFNITDHLNNKLSGFFSGTLAGPSGNQPVSGSFTNMPVKP